MECEGRHRKRPSITKAMETLIKRERERERTKERGKEMEEGKRKVTYSCSVPDVKVKYPDKNSQLLRLHEPKT